MKIEISGEARLPYRYGFYERFQETEIYLIHDCLSPLLDRTHGNVTVIASVNSNSLRRKISYISSTIYKCKFHYVRLSRCGRDCVRVLRHMLVTSVKLEGRDARSPRHYAAGKSHLSILGRHRQTREICSAKHTMFT